MTAPDPATEALGPLLLRLARQAIAGELGLPAADPMPLPEPLPPALAAPGATFVTLTRRGRLRGCIGSLEASRSLAEDVMANARAAAFRDPRFPPLAAAEWPEVQVEVSLLQPARPLAAASEAEALARLQPGRDGLILQEGQRCATFLPQVWEALPDPGEFLAALKHKAGLPRDYWSPQLELSTYRVAQWKESQE